MSLEHSPARSRVACAAVSNDGGDTDDLDYWNAYIDEQAAAAFLDLTRRTVQEMRQRGDGPAYIRLSARCIRYTRRLLKEYADKLLRTSTADPGPEDTE